MNARLRRVLAAVLATMLVILPAVALANSQPQDVQVTVPLDVVNPCTGELVTSTWTIDLQIHPNTNGGIDVVVQDKIRGTGESTSGTKYQGNGHLTVVGHTNLPDGSVVVTAVATFNFISQGSGDNFTVHGTVHLTVSPSGNVNPVVTGLRAECRG